MGEYHLPHSPQLRVLDRFSTLPDSAEGEDGNVSWWLLLSATLERKVTSASDATSIMGEIAVLLRGTSGDYETLQSVLPPYISAWPKIVAAARSITALPATLPLMRPEEVRRLPRTHLRSLVAHQFLASLVHPTHRPPDGWSDFEIWYHSEQRHPAAATMYITSVLEFLSSGSDSDSDSCSGVQFELRVPVAPDLSQPMRSLQVSHVETFTAPHPTPGGMVVSANRIIGFGQSATQEEVYFGAAPVMCPAVLFVPPLAANVLVVSGIECVLEITGERRAVSWIIQPQPHRSAYHTFLLMDALELDEEEDEAHRNLEPSNVNRELQKATTAFIGSRQVSSPAWGCGAFCGDPAVKLVILWMAASVAGADLELVIGPRDREVAQAIAEFSKKWTGKAEDLRKCLGMVPVQLRGMDVVKALEHKVVSGTDSGAL